MKTHSLPCEDSRLVSDACLVNDSIVVLGYNASPNNPKVSLVPIMEEKVCDMETFGVDIESTPVARNRHKMDLQNSERRELDNIRQGDDRELNVLQANGAEVPEFLGESEHVE